MDARRKKLIYRATYRGFKEADILLGDFARARMEHLSDGDVTEFETLLGAKDHDIYNWIARRSEVPAEYDLPIIDQIRAYAGI